MKLPLILLILLYVGFVIVLIFVAITSLYVLGTLVGIPTLQLLTGAVSAGSAAASASAAILIWRANVQARKTVLIDHILGPAYSEVRQTRELLESWKNEAKDVSPSASFLSNASSDWRYYTLDPKLRSELENFRSEIGALEDQRVLCKKIAGPIVTKAASETFGVKNASTVYLWRSHMWTKGQIQGENGRQPTWELVIEAPPLWAPLGYHVHALQVVDFNSMQQYSLPLLDQNEKPLNVEEFDKFWEHATKLADAEPLIVSFREARQRFHESSANLEGKLDSEIKHLR